MFCRKSRELTRRFKSFVIIREIRGENNQEDGKCCSKIYGSVGLSTRNCFCRAGRLDQLTNLAKTIATSVEYWRDPRSQLSAGRIHVSHPAVDVEEVGMVRATETKQTLSDRYRGSISQSKVSTLGWFPLDAAPQYTKPCPSGNAENGTSNAACENLRVLP